MSRETKERNAKVAKAFANLHEAREGGVTSRLRQLEIEAAETDPRLNTIAEDDYRLELDKQRSQDAAFIVDDDGIGYLDNDDQGPQQPRRRKRPSTEKKECPTVKKPALEKKEKDKKEQTLIDVMNKAPEKKKQSPIEDTKSDALLAEILKSCTMDSVKEQQTTPNSQPAESTQRDSVPAQPIKKEAEVVQLPDPESPEICPKTEQPTSEAATPITDVESDILPFYFIDADENPESSSGIHLVGRAIHASSSNSVSCCVRIRSLERVVYVVPRVDLFNKDDTVLTSLQAKAKNDAKQKTALVEYLEKVAQPFKHEVQMALKGRGVRTMFRMKIVERNYAFDFPTIPHGSQYVLKVMIPAKGCPSLAQLSGKTFQAVLATKQSLLESLLLRRKIMGPSWMALRHSKSIPPEQRHSWCSMEVEIGSHKDILISHPSISNRSPPKLTIASIQLKTVHQPQKNAHEIVTATIVHLDNVCCDRSMSDKEWNNLKAIRHFHILTKCKKQPWPPGFEAEIRTQNQSRIGLLNDGRMITVQESERLLLMQLLERIHDIDPDVLVGHDITNVDLNLLVHRMQVNKVEDWSRIGRLKRMKFPTSSSKGSMTVAVTGRLLCDTFLSAHEFLREVEFSLKTLAKTQFDESRSEMEAEAVEKSFDHSDGLFEVMEHSRNDAILTLRILFHLSVLPLTKQLTNLSGNLWNGTLQGQRVQRTDMLLMHEFHNRKFMLPEKRSSIREKTRLDGDENRRAGPQYTGGLVLEPKKGLYDNMILLLDFNSLYPSIIQEFKLCFTTVDRSVAEPSLPGSSAPFNAPLPTVIKGLIDSRRQVKKLIAEEKDPVLLQQRRIREQALKLTANSMYGCLGYPGSRFSCKPLAEMITAQGRALLQRTADLVEGQLGYEVVYGDTDSIMINTGSHDYDEVRNVIAEKIKRAINKDYRVLRIDVDGVFQPLLLLKKKKYAAMKIVQKQGQLIREREEKGLDTVRRDWSKLAKDAGTRVLAEILSGKPIQDVVRGIHNLLREVKSKLDNMEFPLSDFEIVKELAKHPEEYPEGHNQAHVNVALRRKKQGHRDCILPGQAVPYIICTNASGQSRTQAERAYHADEIRSNPDELCVDVEFYITNQIYAVVSRLCEEIEKTDANYIAECLGMNSTKHSNHRVPNRQHADNDDRRYLQCKPIQLHTCGESFSFAGAEAIVNNQISPEEALRLTGEASVDNGGDLTAGQIANQVMLQARQAVSEYYDCFCSLEDGGEVMTRIPHYAEDNGHRKWKRVITERQLYRQLSSWIHQLDIPRHIAKVTHLLEQEKAETRLAEVQGMLNPAHKALKEFRQSCAYGIINYQTLLQKQPNE